ncbi:MAG TPA: dihydroorotase, partial [Chitinophagaceae bacterium]|nr:dihydroorotase [Chitinophagaceae bacterium]
MTQLLIKKATILAPESPFHLKKKDILIKNGLIEKVADQIPDGKLKTLQGKNTYISAGWVDMFADFCDPGYEHKEDLTSGKLAALKGGYTDVCLIPNTQPAVTSKGGVEWIKQKSDIVNLHPIGAISAKIEGKDLAEMYDMQQHGAVAFSDGTQSLQSAGLMLKALQYVKAFKGVIIQVPEEKSISGHGLMHEGTVSTALGMQGKPAIAESIMVQRDLELLRYTQSRLHFSGISTAASINLIRKAKKEGLHVTCSVAPYHLLYTHDQLQQYNSIFKVNPP